LIEPVLKQHWFRPTRDWMEFSLAKSTKLPAAPAPRGVRLRDATRDDAPELSHIDREAFPDTPIPLDALRARFDDESAIVAVSGNEIAGFCMYYMPDESQGWISVLAVGDGHRGRGIGAALTVRAAKRLFAQGARTVGLTTDDDNGDAIRLYVRLGFRQTHAGRDYSRPTDPRAIAEMKRAGEGTFIRFGGWR
jgi:ribosomal protein S18 acetylase RimI-like enzyme